VYGAPEALSLKYKNPCVICFERIKLAEIISFK